MIIVNDINKFTSDISNRDIFIHFIFSNSYKHYVDNDLSMAYIRIMNTNNEYVIGFGHPDLPIFSTSILNCLKLNKIYTINQKHILKYIDSDNIIDITLSYYLSTNSVYNWKNESFTHIFYYRRLDSIIDNINDIIPFLKHVEIAQYCYDDIIKLLQENSLKILNSYANFNKILYKLESNKIRVDLDIFKKHYPNSVNYVNKNNFVFSYYNLYTSTGRPSNSFGGVNFAAINKIDGSRKSFIPKNNYFLLFDFDSFHLNLIAKIIGYKFDEKNIHYYLGKYYYKKSSLTLEEYEKSKRTNFIYLYNGVPKKIRDDIPFFSKVHTFIYNMWAEINKTGKFKSFLTNRYIYLNQINEPNAMKVFNYFIQLSEMETGMVFINKLINYLNNKKTDLILYTYDSFLFDYSLLDGSNCIKEISNILNLFSFKIYFGKNYHDMIDVTDKYVVKT